MEYNTLHGITPKQVEVKHNILAAELGAMDAQGGRGLVSAKNSVAEPNYIPSPSELGTGRITVGLGQDSGRDTDSAYVEGYVKADLAAVLQDPVIRAMSRDQIKKMISEDERRMRSSASKLDFTQAARYRDEMWALKEYLKVWKE